MNRAKRAMSSGSCDALRHPGALDQDRDDPYLLSAQRAHHLESDEVVRLIDATHVRAGPGFQPLVADHHEHDVTLGDLATNVFLEVGPGWDRVEIHEDLRIRQPVAKSVVQSVGLRLTVAPAIEMKMRCALLMFPSRAR